MLELKCVQLPLLPRPVGSHGVSQHRIEMFDWQSTENQQFQQLYLYFWIFDRISPTFDQSPDSFIPICVQQYSEQVYQVALNSLLDLNLALSYLKSLIVGHKMLEVIYGHSLSFQPVT